MKTFKFGLLVNILEAATQTRVSVNPELHVKDNGKPAIIVQVHQKSRQSGEDFESFLKQMLSMDETVVGIAVTLDDNLINKVTYPGFPKEFNLQENQELISQCTVYGVSRGEKHAELMIGLVEE